MSQEDVYNLLKDLGGKATTNEIKEAAKKKYPDCSLYTYVWTRLSKLEQYGCVKHEKRGKDHIWIITGKF
jgi:uncharacterized membrane protein